MTHFFFQHNVKFCTTKLQQFHSFPFSFFSSNSLIRFIFCCCASLYLFANLCIFCLLICSQKVFLIIVVSCIVLSILCLFTKFYQIFFPIFFSSMFCMFTHVYSKVLFTRLLWGPVVLSCMASSFYLLFGKNVIGWTPRNVTPLIVWH
jgi:hypothetical protein